MRFVFDKSHPPRPNYRSPMKWFLALASLSFLASCSSLPWMVGSVNDKGYCADDDFPGGEQYTVEEEVIEAGPMIDTSGKSGK